MNTKEFLLWIRDRLINVYNESPQVDFVQKLTDIAEETENSEIQDWYTLKDSESGEIVAYYNPKFITSEGSK